MKDLIFSMMFIALLAMLPAKVILFMFLIPAKILLALLGGAFYIMFY